ncbi:MBL fold metallo-hydrolase [Loigolactobacillus coryniformis]|uniref:MBL fold metallo-hydrolase n=1 Tax=Loigolactobacillus coryniformis TaxID=1610 RepID=UPI00345CB129
MDFFKIKEINSRLTTLTTLTGEILYLLQGDQRSVLVDTSVGVQGLHKLVSSLTDKPVTVILTHGHVDHAPGAPEFAEVYLNPVDNELYREHCQLDVRKGYLEMGLAPEIALTIEQQLVPPEPDFKFHDLSDGQIFDLGGLHIECYSLPGHTAGTMVLLIPELAVLISGDAANKSTFLFDTFSAPVETYRANLVRIQKRLAGRYQHVYITHHVMEVDVNILQNLIDVCDDIIAGKADDIPFDFMGNHAFIAKKADNEFNRQDGIEGDIIFSKQRIWNKQLN